MILFDFKILSGILKNMDTITLPKQINSKIRIVSKSLGVSMDVFTLNAVLFYMQNLKNKVSLRNELDMWDKASNNDLLNFEKSL